MTNKKQIQNESTIVKNKANNNFKEKYFLLIISLTIFLWAFAFQIIDATATAILVMGSLALFIFIGLAFWMKKGTMAWV